MRSLTFTLDVQTGDDEMAPAQVTITEMADGSLSFTLSNENDADTMIGDLRALFFDVADDSLLGTLSFDGADVTEVQQDGSVSNLGGGATSNGVPDSPYEVGVEIGSSGAAENDIQTTTFIMSSSLRALTLDDIALESFTVRQTSVGDIDGPRDSSDKLWGDAPYPVNAIDDIILANENDQISGNLIANDIDLDAQDVNNDGIIDQTIVAIDGNNANVDQTIVFENGVSLYVANDGNFVLDADGTNYLSQGEILDFSFTYTVDDGNGGTDSATTTITIEGLNDAPIAFNDLGASDEASILGGNVLDNDSDIDRLDTLSVNSVNGDETAVGTQITLASGALLTLNQDGTYQYDPNGAWDFLNDGESAVDTFSYEVSDDHGATASASVSIEITGIGSEDKPLISDGNHFGTFANKTGTADHDISNIVLYMSNDEGMHKVKIDNWSGVKDLDDVNLDSFMDKYYSDYDLLGVSIKAGNNHNKDLGPGEGQFFLIDGDEDIDYVQNGPAPEGISYESLSAKADETMTYSQELFS